MSLLLIVSWLPLLSMSCRIAPRRVIVLSLTTMSRRITPRWVIVQVLVGGRLLVLLVLRLLLLILWLLRTTVSLLRRRSSVRRWCLAWFLQANKAWLTAYSMEHVFLRSQGVGFMQPT